VDGIGVADASTSAEASAEGSTPQQAGEGKRRRIAREGRVVEVMNAVARCSILQC
jgi:hypothetical protein